MEVDAEADVAGLEHFCVPEEQITVCNDPAAEIPDELMRGDHALFNFMGNFMTTKYYNNVRVFLSSVCDSRFSLPSFSVLQIHSIQISSPSP